MAECCTPLLESPVDTADADHLASRFKALSDPNRVRLLSMISARGEVCACELVGALDLSQPTISHHLKVLHEAGLLTRERRGRWIHYAVDAGGVEGLRGALAVGEPIALSR
jgi:ArsR family transcriptional regulator